MVGFGRGMGPPCHTISYVDMAKHNNMHMPCMYNVQRCCLWSFNEWISSGFFKVKMKQKEGAVGGFKAPIKK